MTEPTATAARTWQLQVPACGWLTSNPKSTSDRYSRSAIIRAWREATVVACHSRRLPRGEVNQVTIEAVAYYVGRRPVRDRPNLYPTIKAVVDGLVPEKHWRRDGRAYVTPGYGFLPDDSDAYVLNLTWDLAPSPNRRAWVELTIREILPCTISPIA